MSERLAWLAARLLLGIWVASMSWNPGARLAAQTAGALEGVVLDISGAPAAGVALRITGTLTRAERRLATDARGRFLAPGLAPGLYELEASHPGFKSKLLTEISLAAGRTVWLPVTLELGELRERVEVTAEATLTSTRAGDWASSVDRQALESLPVNGRDLFGLASQQPGVTVSASARVGASTGAGIHLSVNGARPNQNSFRLDGVYIGDWTSSAPASVSGSLLGMEGIQELRVVTSPFTATLGRAAGAPITAVTKSGSNSLHGSVYEYFRNDALDAKNFFDSPAAKTPPLRKNQFGGSLGGPLVRDRIFFFTNYEGIRSTSTQTVSPATITQEARQGRIPQVTGGVRTVQVAASVRPYLDLYPLPNGRDFGDGTGEFLNETVTPTREDYVSAKGDLVLSDRLRSAVRYSIDNARTSSPDPFRIWTFSSNSRNQFLNAEAQFVQSPATIHSLSGGLSRVRYQDLSGLPGTISSSMSFVPGQPLGTIDVVGLSEFGGLQARLRPRRFLLNDAQLNYQATHIRGPHTLQFGAGFDRVQLDEVSDNNAVGSYRFTSLVSFLEGRPQSGDLMVPGTDSARSWSQNQFHAFAQEDLRVSPRLSLMLGVRHETYSVPTEANGKIASLRDPAKDSAVTTGRPLFVNPSRKNLAPRAAIAWDPFGSGRTVLRAGAGLFFDLIGTREIVIAGNRMPPFFQRVKPANPGFPGLLASVAGAPLVNVVDGLEFYVKQPYVIQYQFAVQHQVGARALIELGYAGSRGIHLSGQVGNLNTGKPTILPDGRLYFPSSAPRVNPAFDQIGMRLMQFNSFYQGLTASLERTWRSGLRLHAKYTWAKSIDETSNATFDDFLNSDRIPTMFNFRQNRGLSDFDTRHSFTLDFSWPIPGPSSPALSRLLAGWEAHGLSRWQTGNPFNPWVGFDRAGLRAGSSDLGQRPDYLAPAGAQVILGDPQCYFDPSAFALPGQGVYGSLGRNTLTGPGLATIDAALHRVLWSTERHNLRLRVEAFNVANHPNFQLPSGLALFNSSLQRLGNAGRITATSTTSRQVQVALRWQF